MTFFVLTCMECDVNDQPLPIPFTSAEERGKWAAAHTKGTGHSTWRVWEETRA